MVTTADLNKRVVAVNGGKTWRGFLRSLPVDAPDKAVVTVTHQWEGGEGGWKITRSVPQVFERRNVEVAK